MQAVLKPIATKLEAQCKNFRDGKKLVTTVTVFFAGKAIAQKTIGGTWEEEPALREFKRDPKRFNVVNQVNFDLAQQLRLF